MVKLECGRVWYNCLEYQMKWPGQVFQTLTCTRSTDKSRNWEYNQKDWRLSSHSAIIILVKTVLILCLESLHYALRNECQPRKLWITLIWRNVPHYLVYRVNFLDLKVISRRNLRKTKSITKLSSSRSKNLQVKSKRREKVQHLILIVATQSYRCLRWTSALKQRQSCKNEKGTVPLAETQVHKKATKEIQLQKLQ